MRCDEYTVLDAMGMPCRIRMKYFHLTFLLLQLLCLHFRGISSLRASQLRIVPPVVERGADATLSCLYDLQGAPLYSVKWYRGRHEFYRYSPTEQPDTKIFPFVGINVDLTRSNETQVVLVKVGFRLSGNFTCEVTADAPSFSTSVVSNHMEVVALPKWPPRLTTERGHYAPGDVLRGNCTAPPAKPAPLLLLYLNDEQVSGEYDSQLSSDGLQVSQLAVRVRLLPAHFDRGPPVLRCEALLAPVYRDSNELVLHHARGDPRLQRVTSSTSASRLELSRLSCVSLLLSLFTINRLHI